MSKNLARRQLSPGQKAMVSIEYQGFYEAATKLGRPIGDAANTSVTLGNKMMADPPSFSHSVKPSIAERETRTTRERAAAITGASGRAVQQAKAVQRDKPR